MSFDFDWCDYFTLAEELVERTGASVPREATLRTSVSRAYFAAHCKARNYLRDVERADIPEDFEAHERVIVEFENSEEQNRQRIGSYLRRLRTRRNRADYWDRVHGLDGMAGASLRNGRDVLSLLASL